METDARTNGRTDGRTDGRTEIEKPPLGRPLFGPEKTLEELISNEVWGYQILNVLGILFSIGD